MKNSGAGRLAVLTTSVTLLLKVIQVLFLLLVLLLLWQNRSHLSDFVERALLKATELSVGGVFAIKLESIPTDSANSGPEIERWATFQRLQGPVEVTRVAFDDADQTRSEYLEIVARDWVDLGGGYVGDDNEILRLPKGELKLTPASCLRIYTYRVEDDERLAEGCRLSVEAGRLDGKDPEPIFRYQPGKADRIVLLDSNGKPVLDMDYWWLRPVKEGPQNLGATDAQ